MRTSPIKPGVGQNPAGSRPRSNGIRANFIRVSASSHQTWLGPPKMSSPSTTSAARANNGSKRARARSNGRGCHVGRSRPMRFVFGFTHLGNFLRTLATPEPIKDWSLTTLKQKLIKIGAKVVSHGRYVAFQMAEVAISWHLFADILQLIAE